MNSKFLRLSFVLLLVIGALALNMVASAQDSMEPSVTVSEQTVMDGTVKIDSAFLAESGFMVIHADSGSGEFASVIGYRKLSPGWNYNFSVPIDTSAATSTLYAMLHVDTGEAGVYEFGTVEGADSPVADSAGAVVSPSFHAFVMDVKDQLLENNTYVAASVTVDVPAFLVVHADNGGEFASVLGSTLLEPGTTTDVVVELDAAGITPVLWPMLHFDTGEVGVYEFGTVEGADSPIVLGGVVASVPVWTVPHVRIAPQIVTHGDGMDMGMAPTVVVTSALLAEPGFVVIHQEADGAPGPVAGVTEALPVGLSENISIELDPALTTANLWPMLHVDTGEAGVYEFGTVEGADTPVSVDGNVVTFQVPAAPSIDYANVTRISDTELLVGWVLIDEPGWLVIHIDNAGAPGTVAGQAQLLPGLNRNVVVTIDPAVLTEVVFPMAHYDTGAAGVYEFGSVEGADLPVSVGGAVVTSSSTPVAAE